MYMLNSFGITLLSVLWGLTVLGIIYTIFFGKWKFSTLIYIGMGCIMVVGGRTFFESIPSNILTMILIGASLYLIGVIFFYGRNIGTTTLSGIFYSRSRCLSLRCYLIGGRV
jgi:hemolysin III